MEKELKMNGVQLDFGSQRPYQIKRCERFDISGVSQRIATQWRNSHTHSRAIKAPTMKTSSFLILQLMVVGSMAQSRLGAFDSLVTSYERDYGFAGAVLIAERDSIIFQKVVGWGDYDKRERLKLTTSIPLASITKSFSAAAVMLLKQQGKLDFDDFVKQYVSDFPYNDVTIRHLLLHTAGFKRLEDGPYEKGGTFDHHDILKYLIHEKPRLSSKPGVKFQYSNTGYSILACVIESVSGLTYSKFMEQNIFGPLEMSNSFVIEKATERKKHAITYNKKWKIEEKYLDSYTGAIGICSTVTDLLKFDRVLYTDRLIRQDILREGFKNGKLNDNTEIKYAFGWRHWKGAESRLFTRGDWWGLSTIMFRDLDKGQTIIFLANKDIDVDSSVLVEKTINILSHQGNH